MRLPRPAAKVHGNIQTPSLIIEQGAIFEGSCKMLQMSQAVDKSKKETKKVEDQPLDTSKMQPLRAADAAAAKAADIPSVSSVVS